MGRLNTVQDLATAIEKFNSDSTKLPSFLWELGRLAKPTDSPFSVVNVENDTKKANTLISMLQNFGTLDDFMTIGADLNNAKYG